MSQNCNDDWKKIWGGRVSGKVGFSTKYWLDAAMEDSYGEVFWNSKGIFNEVILAAKEVLDDQAK